ncbi:nucleoside hydrolase [Paenibacillus sp.]|uniref:nucleoside hydrolase n=1 Tax=Paenibacillus sp. TaxID=58172 RepID=UPI002D4BD6A0|nr:nucleoside hydrolase [Paenibacillus sp.]HZG86347.1 nucleoside hydrolase [Paenibacillus sp.]
MNVKMVLDVDTGIDDALAIAYALASPEIELLGITVSYGMAPVHCTFRNTKFIVDLFRGNTPVYMGADRPLQRSPQYFADFHGQDGLGDTLGGAAAADVSPESAVDFIIRQARLHKRNLTLVTTGPLTNLAQAIAKDPAIIGMIGNVVIMGGAVLSPGNVSKFAEANMYVDPEAADLVFASALPITLVSLDVTRKALLTEEDLLRWRNIGTKASTLFGEFTDFYIKSYKRFHPYMNGCALHDPLAVGVAKAPSLVGTVPMFLKVDLEPDALGRTTEDLSRTSPAEPTARICVQVDAERFRNDFFRWIEKLLEIG